MKNLAHLPLKRGSLTLPKLTRHNPLNPSFVVDGGRLIIIHRACNYALRKTGYKTFYGSWTSEVTDTQNFISETDLDLKLHYCDFLEDRHVRRFDVALDGVQDLKVFRWRNGLFATGSGCNSASYLRKETPTRTSTMMLFAVKGRRLNLIAVLPRFGAQEKNWMPWVVDSELFFVHRPSPFKLYHFDLGRKKLTPVASDGNTCFEPGTSGSSCIVPLGNRFAGMTHVKKGRGEAAVYQHRLFVIDRRTQVTRLSEPFTFEGETIEYGSGLAFNAENVYLGYGAYDERAVVLRFRMEDLWNSLDWEEFSSPALADDMTASLNAMRIADGGSAPRNSSAVNQDPSLTMTGLDDRA